MIELQLIGYTADLGHLVLDLQSSERGRYRIVVEPDLFATLDELREHRRAQGLPVGDLVEYADELGIELDELRRQQAEESRAAAAAGHISAGASVPVASDEDESDPDDDAGDAGPAINLDDGDDPHDGVQLPEPQPASRREMGSTVTVLRDADNDDEDDAEDGFVTRLLDARADDAPEVPAGAELVADGPDEEAQPEADEEATEDASTLAVGRSRDERKAPRHLATEPARQEPPVPSKPPVRRPPAASKVNAKLTPKEIQERLRAGKSVASVAKAAGTDTEWIIRWQQPILAERARILDTAQQLRLSRARLGTSKFDLGEAVARNVVARGVAADQVDWSASRRRDGRWRILASYPYRGKKTSATWILDPEERTIEPQSDASRDLGFVRRKR